MDQTPEQMIWTISETSDGGRTIATWAVNLGQVEELRRWLGAPDVETIASPEVMAQANQLTEQATHLFKGDVA